MSEVTVTDERPLTIYRTEIPNIVFDIGLTPYELALYAHLRRTAGAGGKCTKGVRRLAEESGISTGQISMARKSLCEPREALGGKPLIRVEEGRDERGVRHFVTIIDIWHENFSRFAVARSRPEGVHTVNAPVHGVNEGCSSSERKKEPTKGSKTPAATLPEIVEIPQALRTPEFLAAWEEWKTFRRERRIKPYQPRAEKAQLTILASYGPEKSISCIRHSIAQQYQGLFAPKEERSSAKAADSGRNAGFNAGGSARFRNVKRLSAPAGPA